MTKTPPRPRLALTIGAIGHRPNRIPPEAHQRIAADIGAVLAALNSALAAAAERYAAEVSADPPRLTLLSALAEGADRMAAEAALAAGLPLSVALPFPADDYARDFADDESRAAFRRLLAAAEGVLILPGDKARDVHPYDTLGLVVLENADAVLAVWDGGESAGRGGTTDLVERAAAAGLPVIHIDARGEAAPRLIWSGLAAHPVNGLDVARLPTAPATEAIPDMVDRLVRPPQDADERRRLTRYLAERRHHLNWRMEVPLLLAMIGLRRMRRSDLFPATPEALEAGLTRFVPATPDARPAPGYASVAAAFGFADHLGTRYAQVFRGSYVARFVLAAIAVIVGGIALVGGQVFGWTTWPIAIVQMAIVAVVIVNTAVAAKRDWHGRWRESREVAERIRAAIPSWLLGQARKGAGADEPAWTGWYVRGHLRALGLRPDNLDAARLALIRGTLAGFVEDQRGYHVSNAALMSAIERRLGVLGRTSFIATLSLAALDILLDMLGVTLPSGWQAVLIGLTAGLPVFGTMSFGIRAIGDFEGSSRRSARMAAALKSIGEALAGDPADIAILRARAAEIGDAMLGDVAHWRLATETRRLGTLG